LHGIRFGHDHVPAGELEDWRVDAGKAELEHASRAVSEQLEDLRSRGSSEGWSQPAHGQTLTFGHRGASRRG
jgi:hypothetical protein